MSFPGKGSIGKDAPIWGGSGWGLGKPYPDNAANAQVITAYVHKKLLMASQPSYVNGKIWMPNRPNALGYSYISSDPTSHQMISSGDGGVTWVGHVTDPAPGTSNGFAPVTVLKDASTGKTLLIEESTNHEWFGLTGGTGSYQVRIREVLSEDPFTLGATGILAYGPNSTTARRCFGAIAPGNGFIYVSVETDGVDCIYKINATTLAVDDALSGFTDIYRIAYDGSTAKYGDGFARIYGVSHGSGIYRIKLGATMTIEASTSTITTGGSPFVSLFAGPVVDGPNNAMWVMARDAGDGNFHIVKTTLEPFAGHSYNGQLQQPEASSSAYPLDLVRDSVSGNLVSWWYDQSASWPSGPKKSYFATHSDTGSSFTALHLFAVPESMGAATSHEATGSNYSYNGMMLSLPNGKVIVPYVGGLGTSSAIYGHYDPIVLSKRDAAYYYNAANPSTPITIDGNLTSYSWRTPFSGDPIIPEEVAINDATGDDDNTGSPNFPLKTIAGLLAKMSKGVVPYPIVVKIAPHTGAGYPFSDLAKLFSYQGRLTVMGTTVQNVSGILTVSSVTSNTIDFGSPGFTSGAFRGAHLAGISGANIGISRTILANDTDEITTFAFPNAISPGDTFRVVLPSTVITVDSEATVSGGNSGYSDSSGGLDLTLINLKIDQPIEFVGATFTGQVNFYGVVLTTGSYLNFARMSFGRFTAGRTTFIDAYNTSYVSLTDAHIEGWGLSSYKAGSGRRSFIQFHHANVELTGTSCETIQFQLANVSAKDCEFETTDVQPHGALQCFNSYIYLEGTITLNTTGSAYASALIEGSQLEVYGTLTQTGATAAPLVVRYPGALIFNGTEPVLTGAVQAFNGAKVRLVSITGSSVAGGFQAGYDGLSTAASFPNAGDYIASSDDSSVYRSA